MTPLKSALTARTSERSASESACVGVTDWLYSNRVFPKSSICPSPPQNVGGAKSNVARGTYLECIWSTS